ncbi:glycosyltransferase [Nocardioides sp. KC13]|uniref:Glycosyltransferase n=1 Tax=Nocardioides turkmenicus TaxID=2711220 RepID=A0A6M1R1Z8_9ACTN|nr:glycosyltransferase [Nocardioides sp. KC13]
MQPTFDAGHPRPHSIVALVPAHNEADRIAATLQSLNTQTRPLDRVIVVADNCTDDTVRIARGLSAEVFVTTDNTDKKAGALNQVLTSLLEQLAEHDRVLVADADSTLASGFIEVAGATLDSDRRIGAVGGIFLGEPGGGLLGALQRNEYERYRRQIRRRGDDAMVLTGTATLHRVDILRSLLARRGEVYDTRALTEDNEITLAIKTLGYDCVSPQDCTVVTEVMPTWGDLWQQRLRWQRGALENLRTYRLTRVTAPYVVQQAGMAVGVVAMWLYVAFTVHLIANGELGLNPWWTLLGLVFIAERVVTVWRRGSGARLLAGVLVVEWAYDLFLQGVLVRAALDFTFRRRAEWHHVAAARRQI